MSHLLLARTPTAESCPLATPTPVSTRSFGELIQQKISPFFLPAWFSTGLESWFVLWRDQTSTRSVKVQKEQLEHVGRNGEHGRRRELPFWWQWAVRLTQLSQQTKPWQKIQLLARKCLDWYSLFLSKWIKIYQHKALHKHVTVSTWGVALV